MSKVQSCLIHVIVNTPTRTIACPLLSENKTKGHIDRSILLKPPTLKVVQMKLGLCPFKDQVFIDREGCPWTFDLPARR